MNLNLICEMCKAKAKPIEYAIIDKDQVNSVKLFCKNCNLNDKKNLKLIENIFEFVKECRQNETKMSKQIQQIEADFNQLQTKLLTILEEQQNIIQKLKMSFNTGPRIIEKDDISICLTKGANCSQNELLNMLNQVEKLISQQGNLKTTRYDNLSSQIKEAEEKKYISKVLALFAKGNEIQQSQNQQISNGFIERSEIKLVQQHSINDIAFNRTNYLMALSGNWNNTIDSCIQIFSFENNKYKFLCHVFGPQSYVKTICFSHEDDSFFAVENQLIWFFKQSQPDIWNKSQIIHGFQSEISCLSFSKKSKILAVGCYDISLLQENQSENQEWQKFQMLGENNNRNKISHLVFSDSNNLELLVASINQNIHIYEYIKLENKLKFKTYLQNPGQNIYCLKFYNDLDIFAILQDNSSVYYQYSNQDFYSEFTITKLGQAIKYANFNSVTKKLILKPQLKNEVLVYNISNNSQFILQSKILFNANKIFASNDGTKLALLGDQTVKIYSGEMNDY